MIRPFPCLLICLVCACATGAVLPPLPVPLVTAPATTNVAIASLAWDASPSATNGVVAGYKLYWGTNSGVYFSNYFTPGLSGTVKVKGPTYFAVTAVALNETQPESEFSNEVMFMPPTNTVVWISVAILGQAGTITNLSRVWSVTNPVGTDTFRGVLGIEQVKE